MRMSTSGNHCLPNSPHISTSPPIHAVPITPECIIYAIQGLALSLGFINYPTSGSAPIHIYHINSDQKCLVSINATDLLLQIGCLQNLEQEEVAVLHENLGIP